MANQTRHELTTWTVEARVHVPDAAASGILVRRALAQASTSSDNLDVVNFELGLNAGVPYVRLTGATARTEADPAHPDWGLYNWQVNALDALEPTQDWYHVSATFGDDPLVVGNLVELKLYVDGVPQGAALPVPVACRTRGTIGQQEVSLGAGYVKSGVYEHALPADTRLDEVRL